MRTIEEIKKQMEDNKTVGLAPQTVVYVTLEEMNNIFQAIGAEVIE